VPFSLTTLRVAVIGFFAVVLTACGGGGGGGGDAPVAAPIPTAAKISGYAAHGDPMSGARITAVDKNGHQTQIIAGSDGAFSFPTADFAAPLSIVAEDAAGQFENQIVVVTDLPGTGEVFTVNVTPLTTAIAAALATSGNPFDLALPANLTTVQAGNVAAAQAFLRAQLANLLADAGVAPDVNFISAALVPGSHSGLDQVLDDLKISSAGSGVLIVNLRHPAADTNNNDQPAENFIINSSTVAANTPTPFSAGIPSSEIDALHQRLAALNQQLTTCLAQDVATRIQDVAGSTCRTLAVPGYLDSSYGFESVMADFFNNVAINSIPRAPSLLYLASENEAMVEFSVGEQVEDSQRVILTLRKNSTANTQPNMWEVTGNQSPFVGGTLCHLAKITDVSTSPAVVTYQSGITFLYSASAPNPSNVTTVKIVGPGLPSAGLILAPGRYNASAFFIDNKTGTLVTSTLGQKQTFLFDATATNSSQSLTPWPGGDPAWADQPLTKSMESILAGHPSYTFTLYDASQHQVGSFTRRLGSSLVQATRGPEYLWDELDGATIGLLIHPSPAAQSLAIGWSRPSYGPSVNYVQVDSSNSNESISGATAANGDAATTVYARTSGGTLSQFPALDTDYNYRSISLVYKSTLTVDRISQWHSSQQIMAIIPSDSSGGSYGLDGTITLTP